MVRDYALTTTIISGTSFDLQKLAKIYQAKLELLAAKERAQAAEDSKNAYATDPHHCKAYRFLSNKITAPITFLRRTTMGPQQEQPGTFATDPSEIDGILPPHGEPFMKEPPVTSRRLPTSFA